VASKRKERKPRNGLEWQIVHHLTALGADFDYESEVLAYTSPVRGGVCHECGGKCVKNRKYTPDFIVDRIDGSKVYIESKGRFPSADRSKMRDVQRAHPNKDIRMVFERSSKARMKENAEWCDKNGFYCHFGPEIPAEWVL